MFPLTVNDLLLLIAACLFLVGLGCIGAGVVILVSRVMGEDFRLISTQTAQLARKGIAEEVSGLVGNASALIDSLNDLIKTSSGIGVFLILVGFVLITSAYYLLLQIK
ncbi:MAG: hypothetical protein HPY45_08700 [Anaerolineae bacterium]|nr:hypothetical protein [Anaerolineae bacterium]